MSIYYDLCSELSIETLAIAKFVERKRAVAYCIKLIPYDKIYLHGKIKFTELNLFQGMSK
jgi:hypothetical protein